MRVILLNSAEKSIHKLKKSNPNSAKAVARQIKNLKNHPNSPKAKKVYGKTHECWRIPAGDFRIIYYFKQDDLITIILVGHRKSVYDDFNRLSF